MKHSFAWCIDDNRRWSIPRSRHIAELNWAGQRQSPGARYARWDSPSFRCRDLAVLPRLSALSTSATQLDGEPWTLTRIKGIGIANQIQRIVVLLLVDLQWYESSRTYVYNGAETHQALRREVSACDIVVHQLASIEF